MASANYSKKQLDELKVWFDLNATPSRRQVDIISEQLGLKSAMVWIWFHRQRIREKSKKEGNPKEKTRVKFNVNVQVSTHHSLLGKKDGLALYGSKVKASNGTGKLRGEAVPGTQKRPHVRKEHSGNVECKAPRTGILKHGHSKESKHTHFVFQTSGTNGTKEATVVTSPLKTEGTSNHKRVTSKEQLNSCKQSETNPERSPKSATPLRSSKLSDHLSFNNLRPQTSGKPSFHKKHKPTRSAEQRRKLENSMQTSPVLAESNKSSEVLFGGVNVNVCKTTSSQQSRTVPKSGEKTNLANAVQELQEQVTKLRHVTRAVTKKNAATVTKNQDDHKCQAHDASFIPKKRKKLSLQKDDISRDVLSNVSSTGLRSTVKDLVNSKAEEKQVYTEEKRSLSTTDCNANVRELTDSSKLESDQKSDPSDSLGFGTVLASFDNPLRHRAAEKKLRGLKRTHIFKESDNSNVNGKSVSNSKLMQSKQEKIKKQKGDNPTKRKNSPVQKSKDAGVLSPLSPQSVQVFSDKNSVKKDVPKSCSSPKGSLQKRNLSELSTKATAPGDDLVQKDKQNPSKHKSMSSQDHVKEGCVIDKQKSPKGKCIPVISGRRESESTLHATKKELRSQRKNSSSHLREVQCISCTPKMHKEDLLHDNVVTEKSKTSTGIQSIKKQSQSPQKEKILVTSQCKSVDEKKVKQETKQLEFGTCEAATSPPKFKQMKNICTPSPNNRKRITKPVISKEKYWKTFNEEFLFKKSLSVNLMKINLTAALASRKVTLSKGSSCNHEGVPGKESKEGQKATYVKETVQSSSPDRSVWSSIIPLSKASIESNAETTDEDVATPLLSGFDEQDSQDGLLKSVVIVDESPKILEKKELVLDANQNECQPGSDNEDNSLCSSADGRAGLSESLLDEDSRAGFVVLDEVTCSDVEIESSGTSEGRCSSQGFHQKEPSSVLVVDEVINHVVNAVDVIKSTESVGSEIYSSDDQVQKTEPEKMHLDNDFRIEVEDLDRSSPNMSADSLDTEDVGPDEMQLSNSGHSPRQDVCLEAGEAAVSLDVKIGEGRSPEQTEQKNKQLLQADLDQSSSNCNCEEPIMNISAVGKSDTSDSEHSKYVSPMKSKPGEGNCSEKSERRESESVDCAEEKANSSISKYLQDSKSLGLEYCRLNFIPMVVDEVTDEDSHSGSCTSPCSDKTSHEINHDTSDKTKLFLRNQDLDGSVTPTRASDTASDINPAITGSCKSIKEILESKDSPEISSQHLDETREESATECKVVANVISHDQSTMESEMTNPTGKEEILSQCQIEPLENSSAPGVVSREVPCLAFIAGRYLKASSKIGAVVTEDKLILCGTSSEEEGESLAKPAADEHGTIMGVNERSNDTLKNNTHENTSDKTTGSIGDITDPANTTATMPERPNTLPISSAEKETSRAFIAKTFNSGISNPALDSISPCSTVCYPSDVAVLSDFLSTDNVSVTDDPNLAIKNSVQPSVIKESVDISESKTVNISCAGETENMLDLEEKASSPVLEDALSDLTRAKGDDATSNPEGLATNVTGSCKDSYVTSEGCVPSSAYQVLPYVDNTEASSNISPIPCTSQTLGTVVEMEVDSSEQSIKRKDASPANDHCDTASLVDESTTISGGCSLMDAACSRPSPDSKELPEHPLSIQQVSTLEDELHKYSETNDISVVAGKAACPMLSDNSCPRIKLEPVDELMIPSCAGGTCQSQSAEKVKRKRGLDELVSDLRTSKVICTEELNSVSTSPPPNNVHLPYCAVSINRNNNYSGKAREVSPQPPKPVGHSANVPKGRIRVNKNFKRPPIPESVRQRIEQEAPLPFEQDWKKVTPIIKEAFSGIPPASQKSTTLGPTQMTVARIAASENAASTSNMVDSSSSTVSSNPILDSMLKETPAKLSSSDQQQEKGSNGKTANKPPRKRRNSRKSKKKILSTEDIANEIAAKRASFANGNEEMQDIETEWLQILKAIESPTRPRTAPEEVDPTLMTSPVSCSRNELDYPPPSYERHMESRRSSQESPKAVSSSGDFTMPSILRVYSLRDDSEETGNRMSSSQAVTQLGQDTSQLETPQKDVDDVLNLSGSRHGSIAMPQDGSADLQRKDISSTGVTPTPAKVTRSGSWCANDDVFVDVETITQSPQTSGGSSLSALLQGNDVAVQQDINGTSTSGQAQVQHLENRTSGIQHPETVTSGMQHPPNTKSAMHQGQSAPTLNCSVANQPSTVQLSHFRSPPIADGPIIPFSAQRYLVTIPQKNPGQVQGTLVPSTISVAPGINVGSTVMYTTAQVPKPAPTGVLATLLTNPPVVFPNHTVSNLDRQGNSSAGFQGQPVTSVDRSNTASPPLCTLYPTRVTSDATLPTSTPVVTAQPQGVVNPMRGLHQMSSQYFLCSGTTLQQPLPMGNASGQGRFQQQNRFNYHPSMSYNANVMSAHNH